MPGNINDRWGKRGGCVESEISPRIRYTESNGGTGKNVKCSKMHKRAAALQTAASKESDEQEAKRETRCKRITHKTDEEQKTFSGNIFSLFTSRPWLCCIDAGDVRSSGQSRSRARLVQDWSVNGVVSLTRLQFCEQNHSQEESGVGRNYECCKV